MNTAQRMLAALAAATLSVAAQATVINFDDQGLTGPTTFGAAAQTVTVTTGGVTMTLSGGVILTNTTNLPVDSTSVYGSASFVTGLSNPLTVSFSLPVHNIIFDVLNGWTTDETFLVMDNFGNTSSFTLPPNLSSGAITIGLISDASSFTITQNGGQAPWDFFIDNIHFNEDATCTSRSCSTNDVPLPATLPLAALGLLGLGVMRSLRRDA